MKIMDFLFGKKPPIFNKKSEVEHDLSNQSWEKWKNRYLKSAEYNWRQHDGMVFQQKDQSSKDFSTDES